MFKNLLSVNTLPRSLARWPLVQAAIKFYMDKAAFQSERDLYEEPALKSMMPATLAIEENASGEHATPYGYTFPPFVIIECGQSLDEWARDNANTDFITIFQVIFPLILAFADRSGSTDRRCKMAAPAPQLRQHHD